MFLLVKSLNQIKTPIHVEILEVTKAYLDRKV
jgi:hypothetical protein